MPFSIYLSFINERKIGFTLYENFTISKDSKTNVANLIFLNVRLV